MLLGWSWSGHVRGEAWWSSLMRQRDSCFQGEVWVIDQSQLLWKTQAGALWPLLHFWAIQLTDHTQMWAPGWRHWPQAPNLWKFHHLLIKTKGEREWKSEKGNKTRQRERERRKTKRKLSLAHLWQVLLPDTARSILRNGWASLPGLDESQYRQTGPRLNALTQPNPPRHMPNLCTLSFVFHHIWSSSAHLKSWKFWGDLPPPYIYQNHQASHSSFFRDSV